MSELRQQYITNMANVVCEIMKKPQLTQQDIQFIMLFKSELKRYEKVPLLDKLLNGAKECVGFIKNLNNNNEEKENIDNGI